MRRRGRGNLTAAVGGGYYFQYDPLQRPRTIHTPDWSKHRSLNYDGAELIIEYGPNALLRRYVHGSGADEPLVCTKAAPPTGAISTPMSAAQSLP